MSLQIFSTFILMLCYNYQVEADNDPLFKYKVQFISIKEMDIMYDVVILENTDYKLEVVEQDLNDGARFIINATTGNLQVGPFDREKLVQWKGTTVSAFLEAVDRNMTRNNILSEFIQYTDPWNEKQPIDNNPFQMIIVVDVEDINDNPPEFDIRFETVTLGFPNSKLAPYIAPQFIMKVKAYDPDENQFLKFYTNTPKFVMSSLGYLFPSVGAFENDKDEEFSIFVSDGLFTDSRKFQISVINKEHILILTVHMVGGTAGIEWLMYKFENETKFIVYYFSINTLPFIKTATLTEYEQKVRVVAYALDNGKPVEASILKRTLENLDIQGFHINIEDFQEPCNTETECDNNMFKCKDDTCINEMDVCNGIKDCIEGEDERECNYHTAYGCEGDNLIIECNENQLIRILSGNYGRTNSNICNWQENENCIFNGTTDILKNMCDLRQNCTVKADNNIFGDPCELTQKYLEAHYQCLLIPQEKVLRLL